MSIGTDKVEWRWRNVFFGANSLNLSLDRADLSMCISQSLTNGAQFRLGYLSLGIELVSEFAHFSVESVNIAA